MKEGGGGVCVSKYIYILQKENDENSTILLNKNASFCTHMKNMCVCLYNIVEHFESFGMILYDGGMVKCVIQ